MPFSSAGAPKLLLGNMKKLISLIVICFSLSLSAQQDARYSQYMFNGLVLNPAYAGTNDYVNLAAFYRNQWLDIPGAPKTISLSAHSAVGAKKKVGLGFFLENDTIGHNSIIDIFSSYSYKLPLTNGVLVGGIQVGGIYIQFDGDLTTPDNEFDIAFISQSTFRPNFGVGLYYYNDRYYAGISAPHLLNYTNDLVSSFTRYELNYFVTAGAAYPINEALMLKPSFLVRYQPTGSFFSADPNDTFNVQTDLSAAIWYLESLWFGTTYRSDKSFKPESIVLLFSYHFTNGMKFGYAFDQGLSDINSYQSGSHEIMFGYSLDLGKAETTMSPRYF